MQRNELLLFFAGALLLAWWRSRPLTAVAFPVVTVPPVPLVPSVSTESKWFDPVNNEWRDF